MSLQSLAAFGLEGKPHVANSRKWQSSQMRQPIKSDEETLNPLQVILIRRLKEEMKRCEMSGNSLAKWIKENLKLEISQRTIARILTGEQEPGLQKIHALAMGLGVKPWQLFVDSSAPHKVVDLPHYPEPFGRGSKLITKSRSSGKRAG